MTDRAIEELLPAYVNGTLTAADAETVAAALEKDPALAQEQRFLHALRDELQRPDNAAAPGDMGWHRLRRGIAAERRAPPQQRWRLAVGVAAAAVIAVQAGLLWRAYSPTEPGYIPLSAEAQGQIQVRFTAAATAAEIERLLSANNLVIVAGPSAAGVYRLRLIRGAAGLDAVIEALAARESVIAHAARE